MSVTVRLIRMYSVCLLYTSNGTACDEHVKGAVCADHAGEHVYAAGAVSYTHLEQSMAVIKAVSSKEGIGHAIDYVTKKEKTEAVSYTHLDVYKRQVLGR